MQQTDIETLMFLNKSLTKLRQLFFIKLQPKHSYQSVVSWVFLFLGISYEYNYIILLSVSCLVSVLILKYFLSCLIDKYN